MLNTVLTAIALLRAPVPPPDESFNVTDGYSESVVYQSSSMIALKVLMFSSIGIGLLAIMVIALALEYSPIKAYGITERLAITQLTPIINKKTTDHQALIFAKDKAISLMSMHFNDYRDQVAESRKWFSGDGWTIYQKSLIANKVVETVKNDGLIVTAISSSDPILERKYVLNGRLNWDITVPLFQTIQGPSKSEQINRRVAHLTLEEARRDDAEESLKIRVFTVTDR